MSQVCQCYLRDISSLGLFIPLNSMHSTDISSNFNCYLMDQRYWNNHNLWHTFSVYDFQYIHSLYNYLLLGTKFNALHLLHTSGHLDNQGKRYFSSSEHFRIISSTDTRTLSMLSGIQWTDLGLPVSLVFSADALFATIPTHLSTASWQWTVPRWGEEHGWMGTFLHVLSKRYKLSRVVKFCNNKLTFNNQNWETAVTPMSGIFGPLCTMYIQKKVFKYNYSYKMFTKTYLITRPTVTVRQGKVGWDLELTNQHRTYHGLIDNSREHGKQGVKIRKSWGGESGLSEGDRISTPRFGRTPTR